MIPQKKWKQFGLPNAQIKGIVIHNTNSTLSAAELEKWMLKSKTSQGTHFIVDDKEIRQVMPLDWSCWNTGMGYDFGNLHCISLEICSHPDHKKYLAGQKKSIELIEQLMHDFHLTSKDIYFHRDFNKSVNCPATILSLYGSKKEFIEKEIKKCL